MRSAKQQLSRREFLCWSGLAAVATALAACTPTSTPTQAPSASPATQVTPTTQPTTAPKPAPAENVELRWAEWPGTDGPTEAIAEFQEMNPGVTITFEPHGTNFDQKLMAACVAGTAPDIMSIYGNIFFAFADKGQILDLQPLVDENMTKEEIDDFYPWHWPNGFTVPETGLLCGMPWKINVTCIAYNQDLFEEVGVPLPTEEWTHDEYADALRRLNEVGSDGKNTRWGGYIRAATYDRMQCHILAYGGHVVDPDDRRVCMLGEEPAQEALEWIRQRMWDDKALMPCDPPTVTALGGVGAVFAQGKCGIAEIAISEVIGQIAKANQTAPKPVKWSIMHMPQGPAGRVALGSNDGWAIYKGSKNVDWAWKYITYLTQGTFQKVNVLGSLQQLPARRSMAKDFGELVVKPWQAEGLDMSLFPKALEMGYPRVAECFIKQQESQVAIQEALDKVFVVGGSPVTVFQDACSKIADIHQS